MKKSIAPLFALIWIVLFAGCSQAANSNQEGLPANPSPSVNPTPTAAPPPSQEPVDLIKERISEMSVDEKIGQMVLVGLEGTTLQSDAKEMIERYRVGGFILYKDNIDNASQTVSLLNQLKEANAANKAPLWLSLDQEGGKVNRMPEQLKELPTARAIGKVNNSEYTKRIGQAIGEELQAFGFNMDFAPVLDINSNPDNPVIGNRSFGADPDTVTQHGLEMMRAIQSKDVAAVVKHFPGHGDTSVDSHLELPVVTKSLSELKSFELLPFIEAVREDADAVMIAHLLIPKIDNKYPASLSGKVITDLLRDELAYDGVVITDDMTMGGITKHFGMGEAAVLTVQAGSDILLIGHEHSMQVEVLQALKKGVEEGALTEDRLDQSVYRILKLKQKYHIEDEATAEVDVQAVNQIIEAALDSGKS
ncbi:beta-N-acetylhexosaminidase [Paenibacillus harenae]|uniref:beta-N-acetylhexosaminidase n=1 Tax=Paenibacillus harenae TaxID=306543 RepID=UPI00040B83C8|nr:beta-N-acetylhexosaminidase [Paenibacillus harenae]